MRCANSFEAPAWYEFVVAGSISERTVRWLGDLDTESVGNGRSRLRGLIADQAALYGIIARMRDLGLALIYVSRLRDGVGRGNSPCRKDQYDE